MKNQSIARVFMIASVGCFVLVACRAAAPASSPTAVSMAVDAGFMRSDAGVERVVRFEPAETPSVTSMPEESAWGSFEMAGRRDSSDEDEVTCVVSFLHESGLRTPLFEADRCSSSIGEPRAETKIGNVALPALLADGAEVHVFSIPVARGGNATDDNEYWAVVVRAGNVWATARPFDVGTFEWAERRGKPRSALIVRRLSTKHEAGAEHAIAFGGVRTRGIPKLRPPRLLSRDAEVLEGRLGGPHHSAGGKFVLLVGSPNSEPTVIDDEGSCELARFVSEDSPPVRLRMETVRYGDGDSVTRCVSVVPVTAK